MKTTKQTFKIQLLSFSLACGLLFPFGEVGRCFSQNIGINGTGAAADVSALLDLSSTNTGFLITRVDPASIASPAFGLMTLAPTDSCLYMYSGANWISLGGVGTTCNPSTPLPPSFPCGGTVIPIVEVTSPTGEIWMDRNLGASQVATSSTDAAAYGDLYQWGRCSDGHEKRTSTTVGTQSASDTPGHSNFIIGSSNWRNPSNGNLWQGVSGINNPCPSDYRIPTEAELEAERVSWSSNDNAGAFASPLKLSVGGHRGSNGTLSNVGGIGSMWSSSINGNLSKRLTFHTTSTMGNSFRGVACSIRCIKD